MSKDKPNLVQIDFRVDGDITKEMNVVIEELEKDITKVLSLYGYKNINMEWEN